MCIQGDSLIQKCKAKRKKKCIRGLSEERRRGSNGKAHFITARTLSPTFAHGADEAPALVRPASDGAAAFDLLTPGTGDADLLSHAEVRLGARAAVVPPAWRRRAALGWGGQKRR